MLKLFALILMFPISKIYSQTPNWNAKFIVTEPTGLTDTVWIGCSEFGDNGYQDTLDIIDTEFLGPVSIKAFDQLVEDEFGFGTCTNLRKDVKGFVSNEMITFTLFALSNEYPNDNNLFISWDTLDFIFNENGYQLTFVYLESEFGYISGIDNYNFTCMYTTIFGGDTAVNFINDYTPMYPIDTFTNCSNGNWAIKVNVSVFFSTYPLGIAAENLNDIFRISPNPVQSELTIRNLSENINFSVSIFSIEGNCVYYKNFDRLQSVQQINVIDLLPGIYAVNIYDSNQVLLSTSKIIKI